MLSFNFNKEGRLQLTICALFSVGLLAILISLVLSPPGTVPINCSHDNSLEQLTDNVKKLQRSVGECQTSRKKEIIEEQTTLQILKDKLNKCYSKIEEYNKEIKFLNEKQIILCDESICKQKLQKCKKQLAKLTQPLQN